MPDPCMASSQEGVFLHSQIGMRIRRYICLVIVFFGTIDGFICLIYVYNIR